MSVVIAFSSRASRRPAHHEAAARDLFADLPFAESSSHTPVPPAPVRWAAPGRLAAAPCPGGANGVRAREDLAHLAAAGVRHLIDLTEEHEHASYLALLPGLSLALTRPITWERHPIPEGEVPGIARMNRILDRLDALIAVGATPCVHGLCGRGRSTLVTTCWRVRHGATPQQALADAAGERPDARAGAFAADCPLTLQQRRFVHEWAQFDRLTVPRDRASRVA